MGSLCGSQGIYMYESLEGSFSYEFAYEFAYPIPQIGYLIGYEVDMKCRLGIQLEI